MNTIKFWLALGFHFKQTHKDDLARLNSIVSTTTAKDDKEDMSILEGGHHTDEDDNRCEKMPLQSNWQHLNVPLPDLRYNNTNTSAVGKGSTTWAAHSHTPLGVQSWNEFDNLVITEGNKEQNLEKQDIDFLGELEIVRRYLTPVENELDVTSRLENILAVFSNSTWNLSGGIKFEQENQNINANPDLVALVRDDEASGVGPSSAYKSPPSGKRAEINRQTSARVRQSYRFPLETKPSWKFRFLNSIDVIINNWAVPEGFDSEKMQAKVSLPDSWQKEKKKVFHLVRQVYGQMVSDNRRYGIIHTYDNWFFCKRSEDGILQISRVFKKTDTSPSVFQAIKTMIGFDDYELGTTQVYRKIGKKGKSGKRNREELESLRIRSTRIRSISNNKDNDAHTKSREQADGEWGECLHMALSLEQWDWVVYMYTDNVQLLTTKKDPTIIAKMQHNPKKQYVADEMANEVAILKALEDNSAVQKVIPRFYGHHRRWGVSLSVFGKELDDLDDIGLENLSDKLKHSAVQAVEVLSKAGILHNDIELRNFVQSKEDPNCAKIIDFGRATFSSDSRRLAKQVDRARTLFNIDGSSLNQTSFTNVSGSTRPGKH